MSGTLPPPRICIRCGNECGPLEFGFYSPYGATPNTWIHVNCANSKKEA